MDANLITVEKIKRGLLVTIGIVVIVMAYYIITYKPEGKGVPPKITDVNTTADVMVNNLELSEEAMGQKSWILRAQSAEIYNARKEVRGTGVEVDFFDKQGKRLHLKSDSGIKDDKSGTIKAVGNVHAMDLRDGTTLDTEELIYNINTKQISTDNAVTIKQGNMVTVGDGLESDIDLSHAKIKNGKTSFSQMGQPSPKQGK